jgi:hypothetical protein
MLEHVPGQLLNSIFFSCLLKSGNVVTSGILIVGGIEVVVF